MHWKPSATAAASYPAYSHPRAAQALEGLFEWSFRTNSQERGQDLIKTKRKNEKLNGSKFNHKSVYYYAAELAAKAFKTYVVNVSVSKPN